MNDQHRNLNPTKEAQVAMIIWGSQYSQQYGGSMDFWDGLSHDRQQRCRLVVKNLCTPQLESTFDITMKLLINQTNRCAKLSDGIFDALHSIPNCTVPFPAVKILQDTIVGNGKYHVEVSYD